VVKSVNRSIFIGLSAYQLTGASDGGAKIVKTFTGLQKCAESCRLAASDLWCVRWFVPALPLTCALCLPHKTANGDGAMELPFSEAVLPWMPLFIRRKEKYLCK
jgi:hypothetical protein